MAVLTRLELATSAVTGQRSNQLSYSTNGILEEELALLEHVLYTAMPSKCERSIWKFFGNATIFWKKLCSNISLKGNKRRKYTQKEEYNYLFKDKCRKKKRDLLSHLSKWSTDKINMYQ